MYQGYVRFGGRELVNVDRTMSYIGAGYGQPDVEFESPVGDPSGIASVLGDQPYQTPILDEAPWYDQARPETHGFAGVLPLSWTGFNGTTRTVTTAERLGNGGVALGERNASRTMAYTALLVGTDTEAMHAGLAWLQTVLHKTCDDGMDCTGSPLELFTVNPGPLQDTEDLSAALEAHDVALAASWSPYRGIWTPESGRFVPSSSPTDDAIDGGSPGVEPDTGVDDPRLPSSLNRPPESDTLDGGIPSDPFTSRRTDKAGLAADYQLTCLSEVVVRWKVTAAGFEDGVVRLGAVDGQGRVLEMGPVIELQADTETEVVYERPHPPWSEWYPALWTPEELVVSELSVEHRPDLDPEACLAGYRRTYADVTCLAGPTVLEEIDTDDCGTQMWKVEWTFQAGDPFRYSQPTTLAAGVKVQAATDPLLLVSGVQHSYQTVSAASTVCVEPVPAASCALDPLRPGLIQPPAAPVIAETGRPVVNTYRRSVLQLNPDVLPDYVPSALVFRFENDGTAKRGVRVRLYQTDEPDFSLHDECDFDTELWVDYIDPDATLVIDAVAGSVVAVCEDGSVSSAGPVMRGNYRGAFTGPPSITCGGRYFVVVDVPDATGLLTWALSYAIREG